MRLKVRVRPNSGKSEVVKTVDNDYVVYVKKSPENNKANVELVRLLSKEFKRKVIIISGKTSKHKIVEVMD